MPMTDADEMYHRCTMEFYSAIKKNALVGKRVQLAVTISNKMSQIQKDRYQILSLSVSTRIYTDT